MAPTDWIVIGLGSAAVLWINWYFFWSERTAADARVTAGGVQEVNVTVRGGYEPAVIRVRKGKPVRLVFDRQETSSCSEEIVIPDFGIRRFLPAFQRTAVEFTPDRAGTHEITCGMSMLHGRLEVQDGTD